MTPSDAKGRLVAGFKNGFRRVRAVTDRIFSAARRAQAPPPEAVSAELAQYQGALTASGQGSEDDFIRLGQALEAVHSDVNDLVAETLAAIRRTAGQDPDTDEGVLVKIDGLVRRSLADLNRRRSQAASRLSHIDAVMKQLKGLDRLCDAMARLAMNLRVVGFNIRVESARSADSQDMFGVVSERVNRLSENVGGSAEQIRADVRDAAGRQMAASEGIAGSLKRLDGLASGAASAVSGSVQDIQRLMGGALSAIEGAESRLNAVSREIGEVVAGIQIHDSMSQRITHINKALEDAAALCSPDDGGDLIRHGEVAERRFTAAHSIIELQMAQLRRIISDIDGCHDAAQSAFDRIGDEIQGLAGGLLNLKNGAAQGPSDGETGIDPFQALRSDLLGLQDLMTEASDLVDRIQETADAAVVTTERLEGHMTQVDGIGFEIRMIALNAIVKAAHLGETGSALEVVAQEVNTLSNETNRFVGRVKDVLDSVVKQVRTLDDNGKAGTAEIKTARKADLASGVADVAAAYERFQEASNQIVARAQDLQSEIARILSDLGFLPALSGELSEKLARMKAIAAMLRPWVREDLRSSVDEVNRLAERYTMRLERGVHRQLLEAETPSPAADDDSPEKRKDAPEETDDLGDNVELF